MQATPSHSSTLQSLLPGRAELIYVSMFWLMLGLTAYGVAQGHLPVQRPLDPPLPNLLLAAALGWLLTLLTARLFEQPTNWLVAHWAGLLLVGLALALPAALLTRCITLSLDTGLEWNKNPGARVVGILVLTVLGPALWTGARLGRSAQVLWPILGGMVVGYLLSFVALDLNLILLPGVVRLFQTLTFTRLPPPEPDASTWRIWYKRASWVLEQLLGLALVGYYLFTIAELTGLVGRP